jgi:hypothetical protein
MATVLPLKRRRTAYRLPPMVDGSDRSLDTAMYVQSEEEERILVPVRPDDPAKEDVDTEPEPRPNLDWTCLLQQSADIEMNCNEPIILPQKNRYFYMKQFVEQVEGILQAMQAREAMPNSLMYAECAESVAHWRCEDCIGNKVLC